MRWVAVFCVVAACDDGPSCVDSPTWEFHISTDDGSAGEQGSVAPDGTFVYSYYSSPFESHLLRIDRAGSILNEVPWFGPTGRSFDDSGGFIAGYFAWVAADFTPGWSIDNPRVTFVFGLDLGPKGEFVYTETATSPNVLVMVGNDGIERWRVPLDNHGFGISVGVGTSGDVFARGSLIDEDSTQQQHLWRYAAADGAQTRDLVLTDQLHHDSADPGVVFNRDGSSLEEFAADTGEVSLRARDADGVVRWTKAYSEGELIRFGLANNGDVILLHGRPDGSDSPAGIERLDPLTGQVLNQVGVCGFHYVVGGDQTGVFAGGRIGHEGVRRFDF